MRAEREARIGLALGVAGLWATHVLTEHAELQGFLFAGGLIGLSPWLAGRVTRARTLRDRACSSRPRRARSASGSRASCTTWSRTGSC